MKNLIILFTGLMISAPLFSQTIEDRLEDIVTIADGKMTAEDFSLVTVGGEDNIQIKTFIQAPSEGVISRDNFVALYTVMLTELIHELTGDPFAEIDDLDEIIGNPDMVINIYMTKVGIQFEVITQEGTNRITQKWEDF